MFKRTLPFTISKGAISLTFIFLLIEFFDELHYAISGAVLPSLRADLDLSYAQVGLLLGLPHILGTLIEPFLMLLGDTRLRKHLVVGGGLTIILAVFMIANTGSFPALLAAFIIAFPASGAFVTLSQATLMDLNPGREPHMMARWTVAGSLGNLFGPLIVAAGFALAFGWRWVFLALAVFATALLLLILPRRFPPHPAAGETGKAEGMDGVKQLVRNIGTTARNLNLLRWILLLQLSDLLLDVFTGFVPLYFTDVAGMSPVQTSLVLTVLMLASLAADVLLIPVLERFPGRGVVRASALVSIGVYATWLLAPWPLVKIILLVILRFSTLGWYPVLQGEAYASVPGRSGTVMAISSIGGLLGGSMISLIGWIAGQAGLPAAMWLLLLGPVSLALFVPRPAPATRDT